MYKSKDYRTREKAEKKYKKATKEELKDEIQNTCYDEFECDNWKGKKILKSEEEVQEYIKNLKEEIVLEYQNIFFEFIKIKIYEIDEEGNKEYIGSLD